MTPYRGGYVPNVETLILPILCDPEPYPDDPPLVTRDEETMTDVDLIQCAGLVIIVFVIAVVAAAVDRRMK